MTPGELRAEIAHRRNPLPFSILDALLVFAGLAAAILEASS